MNLQIQPYQSSYYSALSQFEIPKEQLEFTASPYDCLILRKVELLTGKFPTVFLQDGIPVGFFVLDISEDKMSLTSNENSILLRSLSINLPYQGKGLGRSLMRMIPLYVKSVFHGVNEIVLSVNEKNTLAYKVYMSTGYLDNGEIVDEQTSPKHVLHYRI